jgi:hypothetical protein
VSIVHGWLEIVAELTPAWLAIAFDIPKIEPDEMLVAINTSTLTPMSTQSGVKLIVRGSRNLTFTTFQIIVPFQG